MECLLCGRQVGMFNRIAILNGSICNNCAKMFPDFIRGCLALYSDVQLNLVNEYFQQTEKNRYGKTASYGTLTIDENHGLFQLAAAGKQYTFDGLDMFDGNLSCTNVKVDKYNHVLCDVEFYYKSVSPYIEFRTIIRKDVRCSSRKIDGKNLEWQEPSDLSMFKNLFNQMLKRARELYDKQCRQTLITKADVEYLKAKALFFVNDSYTEDEIKETKRQLLKLYHPDEEYGDVEKTRAIMKYYELLSMKLREE